MNDPQLNDQISGPRAQGLDLAALSRRTWELFKHHPVEHVLASLVVIVLGAASLGICFGPLGVGQIRMIEKQRRGEVPRVGDVFSGFDSFGPAFLTTLALFVGVALGSLLFVLPGLFVAIAWGFSPWFVAQRDASTPDALGGSWRLLQRHTASVLIVFAAVGLVNAIASSIVLATLVSAPLSAIFCTLAFDEMAGRSPAAPLPTL